MTETPSSPHPEAQPKPKAGELLKLGRARQRLSVADCAKRTHISVRYLEALEESRWKDLPSESHRQGFLRSYARFLGVSHDEVMTLYRQETTAPLTATEQSAAKDKERRAAAATEPPSSWFTGSWVQVMGLIVLMLALTWIVYHQVGRFLPHEPDVVVVRERPDQTRLIPPTQKITEQRVRVVTQSDTWLRVLNDGRLLYEGMLPAGATKEWSRPGQFLVKIGDIRTLTLFWNDQPVDLQVGARAGVNEIKIPLDK